MTAEERAYKYASTRKASKFQIGEIAKFYNDGYRQAEKDLEKKFENEDLINLHKACEWVRKKYGEEAVVNFCKAMED